MIHRTLGTFTKDNNIFQIQTHGEQYENYALLLNDKIVAVRDGVEEILEFLQEYGNLLTTRWEVK